MANNFIFNDNKTVLDGEEISDSTHKYDFPSDASTLEHGYQPFGTFSATVFTVTFTDGGNGSPVTQNVNPFQTIGFAIDEKKLSKNGYYPIYTFNESTVTKDCNIKITENITIDVKWVAVK